MNDNRKTKKQLIQELENLRRRMAELEQSETDRQRAEEAYRNAEARYYTLFQQSPNGVILVDAKTGETIEANETAYRQLGYTGEEFTALTVKDYEAVETPEEIEKHIQKVIHHGSDNFETLHRTKSGEIRNVHVWAKTVQIAGHSLFYSIFQDITEHKQQEEALRLSEERYRTFVKQSSEAIYLLEIEHATFDTTLSTDEQIDRLYSQAIIRECNQIFAISHGYGRPEEMVGFRIGQIFPRLARENVDYLRAFIENGHHISDVETKELSRDGTVKHFLNSLVGQVENNRLVRIWGGKQEISRIKQAEEALKKAHDELEQRVTARMEELRQANEKLQKDIKARKQAEEEIGIINEELRTVNNIIAIVSKDLNVLEILEKVMDEALHIIGLEGGTICLVTPDETLDLAVHRETSEATILDLTTNRIKIGDCLCGECARDHKPLILREREAVLKFSSREAERREDIRFHAAFPLITGGRCLGVLCLFTRTNQKPLERRLKLIETVTSQIAIALENARLYEEAIHDSAILEDKVRERTTELENSQNGLLTLIEDMKVTSGELEKANLRLQELDHLKSMFIASMSHELRTPLNSIIGFTGILLMGLSGGLTDEQQDQLRRVQTSGKHLLALITDVIDISKIEAGKLQAQVSEFSLASVVDQAAAALKVEIARKGLDLEIALPAEVNLNTDQRRLLQCLINLLSNAVKYTEQGTICLSARNISDFGFRISELEENNSEISPGRRPLRAGGHNSQSTIKQDFIEISVADTGIGIREEDLPLLFTSFTRLESPLKMRNPGTGLGLYLTKKITVELLEGTMVARSRPGVGSTFTLIIPKNLNQGEIQ